MTHIDKGGRRFANLEELILTGNLITQVSTAQLPPEIKVSSCQAKGYGKHQLVGIHVGALSASVSLFNMVAVV